jgi:putative component of membrane protein insertase Oxa1/YidC/SpoIIIJ protein YidD
VSTGHRLRPPLRLALALGILLGLGVSAGLARADEPPSLAEPGAAVAFLLAPAPEHAHRSSPPRPRWDGSLGAGISRFFFGTYRTLLSSQDLPLCGFSPSCSAFSQKAVDRCGFLQGALLSVDRLLRDHPLAAGFYASEEGGGRLLKDDPERYCLTALR